MPTLKIMDKINYDPRECLQECLAAWLMKEDKVTSKGGPTWTSLTTALEKIREFQLANGNFNYCIYHMCIVTYKCVNVQTHNLKHSPTR